MTILWLDFETRSRCDLKVHGAYNYALDASTEVLCMSYAFDDEEVQTWVPSQAFPDKVANYVCAEGRIHAHNAAFDRLVYQYVLPFQASVRPVSAIDADSWRAQWYCTAAQARANCLPGSLADLGRALSSDMRKDFRGSQLIRALSIPRADGTFNEDPKLMAEMVAYCEQDVRAMRAMSKSMRELSAEELADYHINERINDRGVHLDRCLAEAAVKYAADELTEIQKIVADVTQGAITSVRSPKMRQWVQDRVGPEAVKLMTVFKDGVKKFSIDKSVRANLLILAEEQPDEVPDDVAEVIQCADDLWASSVAKFNRLAQLADFEDHRVRGAFIFNGGVATGRKSSYGAQVHNFTRKCAKDPAAVREAMARGLPIVPKYGARVTDVLKGMLRPALVPEPGNVFVVADWAGIEARCNPWLSAQPQAETVLDVFRLDRDIYVREAAAIFRCSEIEVAPEQRQIGKVAVLSCGYAGGVGAFAAMGRNYGVLLPEGDAQRTVEAWRRANQWAVHYWSALEEAYTRAMRNPGHEFKAGRVAYLYDKQHLWYILPSGRVLCYPFARLEAEGVTYLKAAWKPAADATEWPRARLWKGLACENITQATANDLLRHAQRQLTDMVLDVHDEIVVECPEADSEAVKARMTQVMCAAPAWAQGLPLAVDVKVMHRYGK